MWNLKYGNSHMNEWEKYNLHRQHLERLTQTRTTIDDTVPLKPSFLQTRSKKEQMKKEEENKISYENRVLFNKMNELKYKPSPYSKNALIPARCPAFEKEKNLYHKRIKYNTIVTDNRKLRERFQSAKPTYRTRDFLNDHNYSNYLKSNISNKTANPNLKFCTFTGFKKKLQYTIEREFVPVNNNNNNTNTDFHKIEIEKEVISNNNNENCTSPCFNSFSYNCNKEKDTTFSNYPITSTKTQTTQAHYRKSNFSYSTLDAQ